MDFNNLPNPAKAAIALLTGTSILGVVAMFNPGILEIVAVGLLALAVLLTAYHYGVQWYQARKSASMSGDIQQHTATPSGVNDPKKLAELDALKRKFDTGLEKFRAAGKDIYKLPWYLFVGEPGSGKTEAIRHCNVGFPPGLQDELQGVGGTVNMDWFFTNRAVMLDTAGRLMFTETSEWREFLKLLKRNRPNCPVNGMFLVIPADSLIKDSGDAIAKKAGKIAEQLETIQRTLDIRFPVFVLITKADLLTGFRAFFDGMEDPQAQHQMLGWSNPEQRDAAFRPDEVDRHLQTVVDRITKRRLGLLGDPLPRTEKRRADEVDSLYSLPYSFELIIPRLKSYLQTIFVAGEWSAKPLFLRGIYFTSALRDGVALDQELANAMGVAVDALPAGRAWDRERAFFLRDLFVEKAFRERGLVTRATNTNALLQKRRALLFGSVAAAAAVFLGFTLYSYSQFKKTVGDQARYWAPAARAEEWGSNAQAAKGRGPGTWHPIVTPVSASFYDYNGNAPILGPESQGIKLVAYLAKLREICSRPMEIGWVYRPLAHYEKFEPERKKAQHIVFEASVVKPLVEAVRQRMYETDDQNAAIEGAQNPADRFTRLADALSALIRIESDAISVSPDLSAVEDAVVSPSLRFVTFNDKSADDARDEALADTFQWTYKENPNGAWPPKWVLGGSDSLDGNKAIKAGLDRLIRFADDDCKSSEKPTFDEIKGLLDAVRAFRKKESEMNTQALSGAGRESQERCLDELTTIKTTLDGKIQEAVDHAVLKEPVSLSDAYNAVVAAGKAKSGKVFATVQQAIAANLSNKSHPLFGQIQAALQQEQKAMDDYTDQALTAEEQKDLQDFDRDIKDFDDGSGRRIYAVRWQLYKDCREKMFRQDETRNLIGEHWLPLDAIKLDLDNAGQMLVGLKAKLGDSSPDGFAAAKYFLTCAGDIRTDRVLTAYIIQAAAKFDAVVRFPLVAGNGAPLSPSEIQGALALIGKLERDINSDSLKMIQSNKRQKLEDFAQSLEDIKAHSGDVANARITASLVNYTENSPGSQRFRYVAVPGGTHPTGSPVDIELGEYDLYTPITVTMFDSNGGVSGEIGNTLDSFRHKPHNRKLDVSVNVGGVPISIRLAFVGNAPDFEALPNKAEILKNLR